ncbi:MAG: M1 family metallopeptidase [Melioribacter sp.]|nr:M1 family metallopeptidase [Melioribacter sp.]
MKKLFNSILLTSTLFLFLLNNIYAQSNLYIPRNIQKAYDRGTRSYDGKPGPNYWINRSDYTIKAELIPQSRTVNGHAWITFYNNSPDSLNTFVFRLYQDIMKKGSPRDFSINLADITDGIKIDTLIINSNGVDFKSKTYRVLRTGTNLIISNFPSKVPPKGFAKIEVKWSEIIPNETRIRMGAYDSQTFFVAYWYPQVAVYDDIDGWDRQEYTGATEFYNDFGNFDVELTVPGDNLVWATGVLQNAKDILHPNIFERYQQAHGSDEIIRIVTSEDIKNKTVTNGKEKNTWHFKAESVPDFSFGTSNKYLWDGSSLEVYDGTVTGKRVFVDACYEEGLKFQDEVALFARLSIDYLSNEWPGIPYPYPKMTVFNGEQKYGGGMETPMMCNNGTYPNRAGQIGVTIHEIAHTYMPFYMGINERKYAFMDEGWATFLTFDLVRRMEPQGDELTQTISVLSNTMGNDYMIPVITPSFSSKTNGSGLLFYQQPALAYLILRDFLGKETFKKALHEYMNLWNGKHPIPYDFFFTFDRIAGEDLSWFWKPWFFESGYPDLAIEKVTNEKNSNVIIKKVGSYPVPIDLKITYTDGSEEIIHKPASVWKNGESKYQLKINSGKKYKKIELFSVLGPDVNKQNNIFEKK